MKNSPEETLKAFGMDPKKVLQKRRRDVQRAHEALFEGVGQIVKRILDFAEEKGFGNASKLRVLQGAIEPGLYALGLYISHKPDAEKGPKDAVSFDSVLFAALYCAVTAEPVYGKPKEIEGHEIHTAHQMFEKIRGYGFRDCFLSTCGCQNCKDRRKKHGIKFEPDSTDLWL